MTEILKPFDPFSMMMDRPIPKPFLQKPKLPEDLAKGTYSLEEGEIDEEAEEEVEEQEKVETKEVPIVLSKNPEFDRDQKIEDLRKNKILITRCDIPEPFPTDTSFQSDAAFLAEEEREEKERSPLEEGEIEEEDEESLEKIMTPSPQEEPYSLEAVQKITDLFDPEIVFVVCSEAKDEKLPGKGAGKEVLPEDKKSEYIPNLAQHKEWRKKLCNAWVQSFSIEVPGQGNKIFQSVDHFLHYSEFSEFTEGIEDLEMRDLLLEDAEKAAEIAKEKKYKGKKITSNANWEETKYDKMYLALHAKFSQHTDLVPILVATKNAKLMYRETHVKQRPFYELMWLRRQYLNRGDTFLASTEGKKAEGEEKVGEKVKGKKREKKDDEEKEKKTEKREKQPIDLHLTEDKALEKVRLGVWEARLPKQTEQVSKKILRMPFYMTNRKKFIQNLNDMFADYRAEIALETDESNISCKQLRELGTNTEGKTSDKDSLFMHQRVVRDYLNLYTPYRGVLLYHSLGSGKTKSSIAIAEGFKTDKKIFVMMPASLKTNYWVELSKAGDPLYKRNQFWEFVPITSHKYTDQGEQLVPSLAKALNLTIDEIRKRRGAWMVDVNKPANFDSLSPENQAAVEAQIQEMISHKYVDIHYNAPNLKKIVDAMKAQNNGANPFDHSVVIIDEAHNFVSRIVNKLKTPASIFSQLYHLLMEAVDCRLVLLSGTPIINYPNELGVMFNLLRGYIKTWTFKVVTTTSKEVNQNAILGILEKYGLRTFDFVEYANNKLILTRNPFSFSNIGPGTYGSLHEPPFSPAAVARPKAETKKKKSKGGRKTKKLRESNELVSSDLAKVGGVGAEMRNYSGVKHEGPYMDDHAFIKKVIEVMEENGISLKPYGNAKSVLQPSLQKALYDDPDKFRETFIQETATIDKNALLNINVLRNRILGLTSYFRSAQEKLLPSIIPDEETGKEFHLVEVPMSDYQFSKYAIIRKEEYEKEKADAKRKRMAPQGQGQGQGRAGTGVSTKELFNISSSYRIFSRSACNFVFPEEIGRPRPPAKIKKGLLKSLYPEGAVAGLEVEGTAGPGLEEGVEGIEIDGSPVLPIDTSEEGEEDIADISYEKQILEVMQKLEGQSKQLFSRDSLGNCSPKFLEMVKRIQDPENEGLHLLYSNFRTLEGIGIFKLVLKENGMEEFRIKKVGGVWTIEVPGIEGDDFLAESESAGKSVKKRFTLYTGTESDEEKEIIRNIYNGSWETLSQEMRETLEKMDRSGKKNADGLIIQVFMITAAGAEGINLRNTRFVHIMEPYWHHVRLEQVIGRARRICSHEDLPEEQRTVKVFVYLSVMSAEQKTNRKYTELLLQDVSKIDIKKPVTTDEHLYEIAQLKLKINQQFLRVIKETAMDCSLYVSSHNKQEKTPLVCYGFGKVTTNEFSSHPILETDLNNTTGQQVVPSSTGVEGPGVLPPGQGLREEKWKGVVVEIAGIKYAMNPSTNEVYNLANYNTGILTFEGILQGRNFVPASEIKNRPQMALENKKMQEKEEPKSQEKNSNKSLDYLDITKKPFLEVAENSLYVESGSKCNFIVFNPPGLKPTLFPFITNEKQLNLLVKASTAISPEAATYEAKYNTEKYNSIVYQNIDKKSIGLSIDYVFKKMKTGVFVRIMNNTLVNFQVLYNLEFTNDFADLLKFKNGMTAADYFKQKYPKGNAAKRYNTDLSKWNATNCLLRNELGDDIPTLAYLTVFYDMIVETCHARKVNDCVFLLNRKDFPYLDAKGNESYDHIYGDNVPMKAPYGGVSFIPILSQSTTERHADIPIPTGDDWEMITQKKFAGRASGMGDNKFECSNGYLLPKEGKEEQKKIPKWEDRKPVFFWRGMATGCGSDVTTNPRLKITKLSQSLSQDRAETKGGAKDKPVLDAGIINFTRRDKKFKNSEYVEYMEKSADITILEKVDRFDQTKYKFNINIEGNSAAYRFGSLFRLGFCVLNVVSKYTLWFEPFLQDRVHCIFVKSDLSDLEEIMEWCLANDAKCKEIAENARKFYDRYFQKEFVFDYLADVFNKTSSLLGKGYDPKMELVPYTTVIKPEMDNYKKRYQVKYETFKILKASSSSSSKNATILIVPFRENKFQNRAEQLENFIRAYASGAKAMPILIVTQSDDGRGFNRGALLNIGFDFLARSSGVHGSFDSFIMHDVDLVFPPEFVERYYGSAASSSGSGSRKREIIHYGKTIKGYYDYPDFLGGAIEFSRSVFERINGFPNHIYGWGGEDDALKVRIASVGSTVYRPDETKLDAMLALAPGQNETRDIPELVAKYKNEDLLLDESIWKINGLNSLHYTVLEETMKTVGVYQIVVSLQ